MQFPLDFFQFNIDITPFFYCCYLFVCFFQVKNGLFSTIPERIFSAEPVYIRKEWKLRSWVYSFFLRTVMFSPTVPEVNGSFKSCGQQLCSVNLSLTQTWQFSTLMSPTHVCCYICLCVLGTSYRICKAQFKMKMQFPLFKNPSEFQDGNNRVI